MGKTSIGRVTFVPRGAYDNAVAYKRLDVVEYEGSSYLFLKDSTSITPTGDGEVTMLLAKRGKDFTYDDFTLEQLEALKGADGKDGADGVKGDKGDTGKGLTILGYYGILDLLKAAVTIPEPGDAYGVGETAPYDIYVFDSVTNNWVSNGRLSEDGSAPITVKLGETPYSSIDGTVSLPAYPTMPDLSNYVTLDKDQIITGNKQFAQGRLRMGTNGGGWANGLKLVDDNGATIAEYGFRGDNDNFMHYFIGKDYNNPSVAIRESGTEKTLQVQGDLWVDTYGGKGGLVLHDVNNTYTRILPEAGGVSFLHPLNGNLEGAIHAQKVTVNTKEMTADLDVNGQIRMRRAPVDAYPGYIMACTDAGGYGEWMTKRSFPNALNDMNTNDIDLTGLDENTWYPVLVQIPSGKYSKIRIQNALSGSSVPSWSTHQAGFSLNLEYESMGAGWGINGWNAQCLHYSASFFTGKSPFGGRYQVSEYSQEVIYLRGGGYYYLYTNSSPGDVINPRGSISIGFEPNVRTISLRTWDEATDDMFNNFDVSISNNNVFATGAIACPSTSDLRLKEIHERPCFSDKLMELGSVEQYNYIEAERKRKAENGTPDDVLNHYGFIYQNIKGTDLDHITYERENGYGAVNYLSPDLLSLIAGAVQENIEEIRKLKKGNQELKNLSLWKLSINSLTRKLHAISNQVVKLLRLKER